ncbi:hypothetical protein HYQ44_005063 [Verticillium longisporum]|nr:hypothetical protein HYQ44_005063 [Verticillium longisporum]
MLQTRSSSVHKAPQNPCPINTRSPEKSMTQSRHTRDPVQHRHPSSCRRARPRHSLAWCRAAGAPGPAALVIDVELVRQAGGRARRALGQVHDDAPLSAGAALPLAREAVPLSFRRASGAGRLLTAGQGKSRRWRCW